MRNKVLFLGSKPIGFFCLNHLIINQEKYNIELVGVLTNNNNKLGEANLEELALKNNISVYKGLHEVLELECDFLISVQYHEILKKKHIEIAKKMAINLHMAPLPEYRGCNQFTFAIIDGKEVFGTTIHIMEEGIDSGAILSERRFKIPKDCFVNQLYDLTFTESCVLFEESIGKVFSGECKPIPQEEYKNSRTSSIHYRKDITIAKEIDLNWDEDKIWKHLKATSMPGFSPPYAMVNGKKIEFTIK